MRKVELTKGKFALVDDKDFPALSLMSWHHSRHKTSDYAKAWDGSRLVYMHHEVIGKPKKGFVVDHINGNGLDNRRRNLRIVTQGQNIQGARGHTDGSSGIKGVSWDKPRKKWVAQIHVKGKHVYLGRFQDKVNAERAYKMAAKKYFGVHAKL